MRTIAEAFLLVFTAELGDKSMLLAMTFATRFPLPQVLIGIFLGILANHGLAVFVGSQAGRFLPIGVIHPLSGILFLLFAFFSLRGEDDEEEKESVSRHIWLACALTFFVGEFGDKTQITAMTLASTQGAVPVLGGTVTAMMCTSILSIWVGTRLGKRIPERLMRIASGVVFLFVGLFRLQPFLQIPAWVMLVVISVSGYGVLSLRLKRAGALRESRLQRQAEALKQQRTLLEKATHRMCLGQEKCGSCAGAACMVGYAKRLLQVDAQEQLNADVTGLIRKEYPVSVVREGLALIVRYYDVYGWDNDPDSSQNRLRGVFETILFGEKVYASSLSAYRLALQAKDGAANWPDPQSIL